MSDRTPTPPDHAPKSDRPTPDPTPKSDRKSARATTEQAPNMGRIVVYHQTASPQHPGSECPAIIQAVHEADPETGAPTTVRLFVFGFNGAELVDNVLEFVAPAEGDAEAEAADPVGCWSWPVIVNAPPPPDPPVTRAR